MLVKTDFCVVNGKGIGYFELFLKTYIYIYEQEGE